MSNNYGPRIVTDGLVLCLDAADKNSYPGSGTVWYDLAGGGNHANLINGVSYNSTNTGNMTFDGTNDFVGLQSNNIELGTNFTLSFTFRQTATRGDWVRLFGHSGSSRYWGIWMPTAFNYLLYQSYLGGGSTNSANYTFTLNNIYQVTLTSTATNKTFYINGNFLSSHSVGGAIDYSTSTGTISIGFAGFHTLHIGQIYNAMIYNNKTLTADQVRQNFEATKGRFGL